MTGAAVEQRLHELIAAVAAARIAIADCAAVDVTGLDTAVSEVCAAAEAAAQGERPAIIAAMNTLIGELDQLAADLGRHNSVHHGKRAAEAYGSGPGS